MDFASNINSGMDMGMTTTDTVRNNQWLKGLETLTTSNQISSARIDDAVRRILRVKFRMKLWERPLSVQRLFDQIGSQEYRNVARSAVRKSLVLLKNNQRTLPLKKTAKVVVCGEWADRIGWQCGGWTNMWQGDVYYNNNDIGGTSLLQGMKNVGGTNVVYRADGTNIDSDAAAVVVFLGEVPYAEGFGDYGSTQSITFNGTKRDHQMHLELTKILTENDLTYATKFSGIIDRIKSQKPSVPIICVLISGRPVIIKDQLAQSDAFVAAWLPGSEGQGVAEVLYGDYSFSGKLSHTWPSSIEQIPINTNPQSGEQAGSGGEPLFKYGFGLSY